MRRIGVKLRKMGLDDIDILILKENFDTETIAKMDAENIYKILNKIFY